MSRATHLPLRLVQIGIPLLASAVGLLAGFKPEAGIAAALGIVYAALVINDLAIGTGLFVVLSFLDSVTLGGGVTLSKLSGGVLFISWLAWTSTRQDSARRLLRDHGALVAMLIALTTWVALSATWAELPHTSLGAVSRWGLNLALFPVVYTALRGPRQLRWACGLFVVGALLSAGVGLATSGGAIQAATDTGDEVRLGGTGLNANELGQLMILTVTLAAALGCARELSAPARLLAFAGAGAGVVALMMTVSRGAIVGLLVSLLVAPVLVGKGRRMIAVLLVGTTVACGALYLFAFAPKADVQRITHPDTTGSGRTDIWKVGLRMVKANPILGVGADNYSTAAVRYLVEPGVIQRSDYIVDQPKPAHNIYLQAIAELGPLGLALMLGIFATCLWNLLRAARRFAAARERSLELLARGLLIGLCGYLVSEFFSTAIYSKQLWLLLAIAMALSALAAEMAKRRAA